MKKTPIFRNAWYLMTVVVWVSLASGCVTPSIKAHAPVLLTPQPKNISPKPAGPPRTSPGKGIAEPKPSVEPVRKPSSTQSVRAASKPNTPKPNTPKPNAPKPNTSTTSRREVARPALAIPPSPSGAEAAPSRSIQAAAIMKKMSLAEKVGQLFILELRDRASGRLYRDATEGALSIIKTFHPGGIILFGGNIDTIDRTVTLIRTVQAASKVPLFVAVDEEGGRVSRLTESGRMHAVHMPAPAEVGAAGDPKLAYREGRYVGSELLSLGINMDLAPVADVDTNPRNRVIGTRSFSSDPQVAARMTGAMVRGLQSMGVSSVIKHFPGHGDTTTDSHLGTAVVHHTLGRLEKVEFVPFRAGISAGADGVLIGHLLLPEILEQKDIPATFSPYILEVLLRKQLDFKKLIITDALNMRAIVDYWSSGTAAIDAFQAGADMLLMPADARTAYTAILEAVKSGEITEKRLDQSIRRILMIKIERQIIGPARILPNPHQVFGSIEGKRILAAIQTEAAKNAGKSSKQ